MADRSIKSNRAAAARDLVSTGHNRPIEQRRRAGRRARTIATALGSALAAAALVYAAHPSRAIFKLNDFYREAWPAYVTLLHGHLRGFLQLAPSYAGSLVLRAPLAWIPSLWGGGPRAVYVATAAPCILAAVAFSAWLGAQRTYRRRPAPARDVIVTICCVGNPVLVVALLEGHPEDVLGAVLCAAAVVLAIDSRVGWASVLTALAVVNKPWGLLAVPVVLFALPAHRRHAILTIGAACAAILLPVMVLRHDGFSPAATGAVVGDIFNPPQLLWWFGPHALIARAARVEIVLLALVSGVVWPIRRSRNSGAPADGSDALLLLALVFLLRAALDPWNTLYYHVPFLFALMAYELRGGKMPVLTMAYSVVLLVVVSVDDAPRISPDFRATLYAIVTVPTIGWLASRLYLAAPVRRRLSLPLRLAQSRRSLKRYSAHR